MTPPADAQHVVIIGAGITGLTAAYRLLKITTASGYRGTPVTIMVIESDAEVGGKIRSSPFAGITEIDEGADAYLMRVPQAVALSRELGLESEMTNPTTGHAAVMRKKLHRIPEGLMLGVPTGINSLAKSDLISRRGKIRAAMEPILPTSGSHGDCVGTFIRQRFGKEVQQFLVDPLVGSIYAADTQNFSLAMVPQLADLAEGRSALLTARKRKRSTPALQTPIFETPRGGLTMLTRAIEQAIRSMGGTITTDTKVEKVSRRHKAYLIVTDSQTNPEIIADSIIVTSPARASATMLIDLDEQVSASLATTDHASVVMVTVKTQETEIPSFRGLSGYLVAKPDQDRVTAVSFGSNKWAHWQPTDGSMILRVSLGRDGATTHDLIHEWEDERLVTQVIDEVSRHTQTAITADISRVTRWPDAFPQYRPGHLAHIEKIERSLAHSSPGVFIAGASMRGIGIPACVAQGENSAKSVVEFLAHLRD